MRDVYERGGVDFFPDVRHRARARPASPVAATTWAGRPPPSVGPARGGVVVAPELVSVRSPRPAGPAAPSVQRAATSFLSVFFFEGVHPLLAFAHFLLLFALLLFSLGLPLLPLAFGAPPLTVAVDQHRQPRLRGVRLDIAREHRTGCWKLARRGDPVRAAEPVE